MKTEPPRVSKRPARAYAWASGSIFRTGIMSEHTYNHENRAAVREQAARPCLRVGLRLYFQNSLHE